MTFKLPKLFLSNWVTIRDEWNSERFPFSLRLTESIKRQSFLPAGQKLRLLKTILRNINRVFRNKVNFFYIKIFSRKKIAEPSKITCFYRGKLWNSRLVHDCFIKAKLCKRCILEIAFTVSFDNPFSSQIIDALQLTFCPLNRTLIKKLFSHFSP